MQESKIPCSKTCNSDAVRSYVINCGHEFTNNVFFVMENIYCQLLQTKQYTTQHPGNIVEHRTVISYVYFYWSYRTGGRGYMSAEDFFTQFRLFKFLKENHENFIEDTLEDIIENDLTGIAMLSEHLFSKS